MKNVPHIKNMSLFQTGYLTIDRAEQRQVPFTNKTVTKYHLHFPNLEVEASFNDSVRSMSGTSIITKLPSLKPPLSKRPAPFIDRYLTGI